MQIMNYLLVERDCGGVHIHSTHTSKRAAYKAMLRLMKKRVTDALDFYRLTGEQAAEWCYRNHSDNLSVTDRS